MRVVANGTAHNKAKKSLRGVSQDSHGRVLSVAQNMDKPPLRTSRRERLKDFLLRTWLHHKSFA